MLQKIGIYKVTGNSIEIRNPNPADLIVSWTNMSKDFKKDYINFWFETVVLSKQKHEISVYGINPIAYKQLIFLDHIGWLSNRNSIPKDISLSDLLKELVLEYGETIDKMIAILSQGGKK